MNKITLARVLEIVSECKKREFHISIYYPYIWEKYGEKIGKQHLVESASGAACTKLIKGRVGFKGTYLISKGKELPILKTNAVAEYSNHWPYDFCYFYKL